MNKTVFIALSLVLGACAVGPDYQPPQHQLSDKWASSVPASAVQQPIQTQWWQVFDDPLLVKYIDQAAENNKDVQVAIANIKRARAARRESVGGLLPDLGGSAGADRSQSSGATSSANSGQLRNSYDASFDASWEIDLFGGNRRGLEASNARIGAAMASYQDIMLSTFADVARTYYEARGTQKRLTITRQNIELLTQTYDLIEKRAELGEASEFDLSRARGEYKSVQARLPNLEAELQASIFSLSVLLGLPPEALLEEMKVVRPLPIPPDLVPVGLRSDILRRRPDIQIAERELAASSADIGVETANLFPKFFITGDIGSQARLFGDLFTSAAGMWSFGSIMQWSVFDGGKTLARMDMEKAEHEAALASYEKTVLEALADTETALTRYGREVETRNRLEESVESHREAVRLARQLLSAGEYDFLAVLDTQRTLTSSESDLVASETNAIIKLISLYTALGGGWEVVREE